MQINYDNKTTWEFDNYLFRSSVEYSWLTAAINTGTFFKTSLLKLNVVQGESLEYFSDKTVLEEPVLGLNAVFGLLVLKGKNIVGEHNDFEKFTNFKGSS